MREEGAPEARCAVGGVAGLSDLLTMQSIVQVRGANALLAAGAQNTGHEMSNQQTYALAS